MYDRFRKWRQQGVFARILKKLRLRLQQDGYLDLNTWFVDATVDRAHKAAAGAFPQQVRLTGGQAGEAPQLLGLLALEEKKPKAVVADKGYDSQLIRKALREQLIQAQIPERSLPAGHKRRGKGRPPEVNKERYGQRNIIERLFGRLKEMRRFACRFAKLADS